MLLIFNVALRLSQSICYSNLNGEFDYFSIISVLTAERKITLGIWKSIDE